MYAKPGRNGGTLNVLEKGETLQGGGRRKGSINLKTLLRKFAETRLKPSDVQKMMKDKPEEFKKLKAAFPELFKNNKPDILDLYCMHLCARVAKNDFKGLQEFANRIEGFPAQTIDTSFSEGQRDVEVKIFDDKGEEIKDDELGLPDSS